MVPKSWKQSFGVRHEKVENPANRRFKRETARKKNPAWSGKMTEGLASPLDCHKKAKITSDEYAL
jgi:hypothetical protein